MADKKISQLTAATTPLAGTEVLPIVQGGSTVKVSAADITAGRNVGMAGLTATGNVSLDGGSFVFNDSGADKDARFEGDTDANLLFTDASTDRVGIGTNTPTSKLQVVGGLASTGGSFGATPSSTGDFIVRAPTSGILEVAVRPATGKDGWISFTEAGVDDRWVGGIKNGDSAFYLNSGTPDTNTNRFGFSAGGNLTLYTGNLVVGTAAKGIDFSANTHAAGMTSELLYWYEEGTWTPVVSDGTNDATMGNDNGGYYTRIGNCVTFTAQVTVGTIDSVGANAIIKGLPFTSLSSTRVRAGVAVGFGSSLNITQGRVVTGYVEISSTKIELQYWDAATGTTGLDGSEISDGGTLFISGHYYTP